MPRGKSNTKKPKRPDKSGVEFILLESRKLTQYEKDLTKGVTSVGPVKEGDDDEFKDAVVKPVIRYQEGDEEAANRVADKMVKQAREWGAAYVYRPERIVVGKGKVRAPDLKPETPPLEAAEMWMKEKKPPPGVDPKEVLDYLEACLGGDIPSSSFQRIEPIPFTVRAVGGENYGPFRNTWKLDIPGTGVFGVTGRYAGEAGRSNRAGKTALIGAIRYAVYGESEYGRDQDKLVHGSEKKMKAQVELAAGPAGVRCVFGRSCARGGSAKAEINGDYHKKADFDEARDEALALPHDDFVRTCFVREGDLHGLLGQGSAQIKADMMRWLGLEGWTHVNRAVGEDLRDIEKRIKGLELERMVSQRALGDVDAIRAAIKDREVLVEELKATAKTGEERQAAVLDIERRIDVARQIQDALTIVANEKAFRARLRKASAQRDKAETKADRARESLGALRSDIKECESNMAGFDGQCPIDDEPCPRVHEINLNDEAMTGKLRDLQVARQKEQGELDGAKEVMCKAVDIVDEMTHELRGVDAAEEVLEKHGQKHEALTKLYKKLKALESGVLPRGHDLVSARDELNGLRADLLTVKKAEDEVKRIDTALADLESEVRLARYVYLLTGKRGVPAMQVEGSARVVEGMANEVLAAMGQDHRLEFAFEKELKKKEVECGACGRPFDTGERKCPECGREERGKAVEDVFLPMVREGTSVRSFDQDSGGGKSMLALAVRIALARFLGVVVLFLDEADKALDDYNLEMIVKMLPRLLEQGFKQVFVISHREYVRDALPRCVEAVRHNGWSEAKWA